MKCNIARDLLPLYFDGLCSEETEQLLAQHFETCEDCRTLKESLEAEQSAQEDNKFNGNTLEHIAEQRQKNSLAPLKKVNKKIKRKNRLLVVCCFFLILFIGTNSVLLYGQFNKKGISYEYIFDAVRFHFIGKEFAKANIEPLYNCLADGYGLRDQESAAVQRAYMKDSASDSIYHEDMKRIISEKYNQFFSGKNLKYKGIHEIGYDEGLHLMYNALYICLKFEGDDNLEYYINLYKSTDSLGGYLADDYFGSGEPLVFVSDHNETSADSSGNTENSEETYHTDDSIFSCLYNRMEERDLCILRDFTRTIQQRLLNNARENKRKEDGDLELPAFNFPISSESDIQNGTSYYSDAIDKKIKELRDYDYYLTDYTWDVTEYDREKFLYRYRITLTFTKKTNLENTLVTFDCYRINDRFTYTPKTTCVYGNNLPNQMRKKMERLFE